MESKHEYDYKSKDIESNESHLAVDQETAIRHGSVAPANEVAKTLHIQSALAPFRFLTNCELWLDRKMGIETQGIDRIPEDKKRPPSIWNAFLMWWGFSCHIGTVPIGALGPEFGLTFGESAACIVVGTFLGALCPAFCGTLGPKLGLRAIATSRYSFGFYGAKLCSILNIVVGGGFAVVNFVICGQLLSAVSDYTMSISVGCVIVGVVSYIISVFGFQFVHVYEKYSWPISFILLLVLVAQAAGHTEPGLPSFDTGIAHAGAFLNFLAINFSSASGWCSIAADYYCNYPVTTKSWKIFFLTLAGVTIPITFTTLVGAIIANAALLGQVDPWYTTYDEHGLGGLVRETYHPLGWSKTALVLLTFSVLGNNVAIFYSSGLSLQLLGHYFHAIPRFIWSFLVALVVTILSVAGKDRLSTIVSNFVSLLGYWTISFTFILLIEDRFFRKRLGYNLEVWDTAGKLPWGAAAVLALLAGYLGGGVTGMSQIWYIGPVAQKFGAYGGDVGIYLSGAITLVVYPIARYIELKYTGR